MRESSADLLSSVADKTASGLSSAARGTTKHLVGAASAGKDLGTKTATHLVGGGLHLVEGGLSITQTGGVVVVKGVSGVLWGVKNFVQALTLVRPRSVPCTRERQLTACGICQAFWTRDDFFIDELRNEYGERVGIYFAFVNCYSNTLMPLAFMMTICFAIMRPLNWLVYLRGLGLLGMLVASVWGPWVIMQWRRRSNRLFFEWKMRGTKELPQRNPFSDPLTSEKNQVHLDRAVEAEVLASEETMPATTKQQIRKFLLYLGIGVALFVSVIAVFLANFGIITLETQLMWTPLCGTYMQSVEDDLGGGNFVGCLNTTSDSPLGLGDRGLYMLGLGICTGLLIDVVYVAIFELLAEVFVKALHIRRQQDYEDRLVHVMFPFHWGGFMFYFLLLAAFVPFGVPITAAVENVIEVFTSVSADDSVTNASTVALVQEEDGEQQAAEGAMLAKEDYWHFWTYEKRFMLEMDTAVVTPLVVAVWLEFFLGQLMPWLQYLKLRYLIRHRGKSLPFCAGLLTRISCCCKGRGGGSPHIAEVIENQSPEGSYFSLRDRLQEELTAKLQKGDITVEFVSGVWMAEERPALDEGADATFEREVSSRIRRAGSNLDLDLPAPENWGGMTDDDLKSVDAQAANALLLESELPLMQLHIEYQQIAQQFAYITMFSIFWALAPLMGLLRNIFEAQADARRMFSYFRRPIPTKPPSANSPIGDWEKALEILVYVACIATSAFFAFCTGELEAWAEVFSSQNVTALQIKEGSWQGCVPITDTHTHRWKYGPESGCFLNGTNTTWDPIDMQQTFKSVMAPNLDCWNDRKVNHSLEICEQPREARMPGQMSWEQISKRAAPLSHGLYARADTVLGLAGVLVWLLLNHVQLALVWLMYRSVAAVPPRLQASAKRILLAQSRSDC